MKITRKNTQDFFNKPYMLKEFLTLVQRDEELHNPIKPFTDNVKTQPETVTKLNAIQKRNGLLNIGKLDKEKHFNIKRDKNRVLLVPISIHCVDKHCIYVGQIDEKNQLNGLGRKIYLGGRIEEGNFNDNKLNGFGRIMEDNKTDVIGHWKDEMLRGFCKRTLNGDV